MEDQDLDFFKLLEEHSVKKLKNVDVIAKQVNRELNFLVQNDRPSTLLLFP